MKIKPTMNKRKKVKRVVLGVGHPWFAYHARGEGGYDTVYLTAQPIATSILCRGGEKIVGLDIKDVGNWNKVRLVLEVLK